MLAEHDIRFGKTLEQPVVNHSLRALRRLLARLKDSHQRAAPSVASLCKKRRRADEPRHVHGGGIYIRMVAPKPKTQLRLKRSARRSPPSSWSILIALASLTKGAANFVPAQLEPRSN